MSNLLNLTSAQLIKAANIKDRIESLTKELNGLLGSSAPVAKAAKTAKKRGMSAAGRARIAAAQKARWAKLKKGKKTEKAEKPARTRKASPVTEKLMAAMKDAGAKGTSVPDVSAKTGIKAVNIRAWIQTTGKKLGVEKLSRGVYAV